jgi:hypothetical protein
MTNAFFMSVKTFTTHDYAEITAMFALGFKPIRVKVDPEAPKKRIFEFPDTEKTKKIRNKLMANELEMEFRSVLEAAKKVKQYFVSMEREDRSREEE